MFSGEHVASVNLWEPLRGPRWVRRHRASITQRPVEAWRLGNAVRDREALWTAPTRAPHLKSTILPLRVSESSLPSGMGTCGHAAGQRRFGTGLVFASCVEREHHMMCLRLLLSEQFGRTPQYVLNVVSVMKVWFSLIVRCGQIKGHLRY